MRTDDPIAEYLRATRSIDHDHAAVQALLDSRGLRALDEVDAARRAFELVRDEIAHSWDIRSHCVTRTASEALQQREGLCYSKAMLLTALLRARKIPAGLTYQRLSLGDAPDTGYCIHGLSTVFLAGRWIRLDARGNNDSVDAAFSLDVERLAFPVREHLGEVDYLVNLPDAHPRVIEALGAHDDLFELMKELPAEL